MKYKSYEEWYGNWGYVLISIFIFSGFTLALLWPRRKKDWKGAGILQAFIISLFAEMFGFPLTIILLTSLLGSSYKKFGLYESHLWAYLLSKMGLMSLNSAVNLVMGLSIVFIGFAFVLISWGWVQIYLSKGRLVTTSLYSIIRHPQYLGLILIILGFNVQWPTLPTLLMGPILVLMYFRLAKNEEMELEQVFGNIYRVYREKVPAFIPGLKLLFSKFK